MPNVSRSVSFDVTQCSDPWIVFTLLDSALSDEIPHLAFNLGKPVYTAQSDNGSTSDYENLDDLRRAVQRLGGNLHWLLVWRKQVDALVIGGSNPRVSLMASPRWSRNTHAMLTIADVEENTAAGFIANCQSVFRQRLDSAFGAKAAGLRGNFKRRYAWLDAHLLSNQFWGGLLAGLVVAGLVWLVPHILH